MRWRFGAILLSLLTSAWATADGGIFKLNQWVTGDPSIARQRAIVAFDGREETLAVESIVHGVAGDVAWVLPLPSEPDQIAAESYEPYGAFRKLDSATQPEVKRGKEPALPERLYLLWLAALLLLAAPFRRSELPASRRIAWLALELSLFVGAGFALLAWRSEPTPGTKASASVAEGGADGVEVLRRMTVGGNDVAIVRGASAQALSDWFRQQGSSLPAAARPAVEAYVSEGWVFAVVRRTMSPHLDQMSSGLLAFRFPTDRAVYPMRLTGAVTGRIGLELYVLADRRAEVAGMEVRACVESPSITDPTTGKVAAGDWVTRLEGELGPKGMSRDLVPSWTNPTTYRATVYDEAAASDRVLWLSSLFAIVAGMLATVVAIVRGSRSWVTGLAIAALIVAVAVTTRGPLYGRLEVRELHAPSEFRPWPMVGLRPLSEKLPPVRTHFGS